MPCTHTHLRDLPATTCERDGHAAIVLHLEVDLTGDDEPILAAVRLSASGPGTTCGEKWAAIWAERAVTKLGWVGLPVGTILAGSAPVDTFSCACTEVSLGPKLWHLLREIAL